MHNGGILMARAYWAICMCGWDGSKYTNVKFAMEEADAHLNRDEGHLTTWIAGPLAKAK